MPLAPQDERAGTKSKLKGFLKRVRLDKSSRKDEKKKNHKDKKVQRERAATQEGQIQPLRHAEHHHPVTTAGPELEIGKPAGFLQETASPWPMNETLLGESVAQGQKTKLVSKQTSPAHNISPSSATIKLDEPSKTSQARLAAEQTEQINRKPVSLRETPKVAEPDHATHFNRKPVPVREKPKPTEWDMVKDVNFLPIFRNKDASSTSNPYSGSSKGAPSLGFNFSPEPPSAAKTTGPQTILEPVAVPVGDQTVVDKPARSINYNSSRELAVPAGTLPSMTRVDKSIAYNPTRTIPHLSIIENEPNTLKNVEKESTAVISSKTPMTQQQAAAPVPQPQLVPPLQKSPTSVPHPQPIRPPPRVYHGRYWREPPPDVVEDTTDYITSLPLELIMTILSFLTSTGDLLSAILTCRKFHSAFTESPSVLECILEVEDTYGFLPTALVHSFRLLEPDIGLIELWGYVYALREKDWDKFVITDRPTKLVPRLPREETGYYSMTSTAWYNRFEKGPPRLAREQGQVPTPGVKVKMGVKFDRFAYTHASVRALALEYCMTILHQKNMNAIMHDVKKDEGSVYDQPLTSGELRKVERGIYVLWIYTNFTYACEFLRDKQTARENMHANIEKMKKQLLGSFRPWDWRVAHTLCEWVKRLSNETVSQWNLLHGWNIFNVASRWAHGYFIIALSPPGLLEVMRAANEGNITSDGYMYEEASACAAVKTPKPKPGIMPPSRLSPYYTRPVRIYSIPFSMAGVYDEVVSVHRRVDLRMRLGANAEKEMFWPKDQYRDRWKLPSEKPRRIALTTRLYYGPRRKADGTVPAENEDDGWAWNGYADWSVCMWDDWRLKGWGYGMPLRRRGRGTYIRPTRREKRERKLGKLEPFDSAGDLANTIETLEGEMEGIFGGLEE